MRFAQFYNYSVYLWVNCWMNSCLKDSLWFQGSQLWFLVLYMDQADPCSLCEIQSVTMDCECKVWCQSSEPVSVFGVTYFWSCVQTDISLLLTMDCECRTISDVKIVSLPLYLVLFIFGMIYFWCYLGTRQFNILFACSGWCSWIVSERRSLMSR